MPHVPISRSVSLCVADQRLSTLGVLPQVMGLMESCRCGVRPVGPDELRYSLGVGKLRMPSSSLASSSLSPNSWRFELLIFSLSVGARRCNFDKPGLIMAIVKGVAGPSAITLTLSGGGSSDFMRTRAPLPSPAATRNEAGRGRFWPCNAYTSDGGFEKYEMWLF